MSSEPHPRRVASALLAALALVALLATSLWWAGKAVVERLTVSESRTVADLAENVGRWASQYGGVHVRTQGTDVRFPGSFLTRSVYAADSADAGVLAGARSQRGGEAQAMKRVESYFWKNPALIQREVADVIARSGSRARYSLTARTVMNASNAPNAFEREALDHILERPETQEYWRVRDGELRYARALITQKSCLTCHTSAASAPEFIRTNSDFNGGGGFGYQEGRKDGLISVTVPIPSAWKVIRESMPPQVWAAAALAAVALGWLLALAVRRRSVS